MSRALAAVATLRQVSSAPRRAIAVASFAARYLSTDEQKVLKELVDDKTKVLDEKVKSAVAVFDVQHKNFKETIGSMPDKITGNVLSKVENVEKTLKTDIAAVKETLAERISSMEKALKADVSAVKDTLSEKTAAVEKTLKAEVAVKTAAVEKTLLAKLDAVGSKFDFVEKVLLRVGWGMVAAAGASIAYAIFRPIADAMVEKKVHEIRSPPTVATATGTTK